MDTPNYQYFIQEFKKISKIDLTSYKDDQMVRRLENFIKNNEFKDFKDLADNLKINKSLVEKLKGYITINVTEFLRNEKMWDDFYKLAIPMISKGKRKIKLWSAACSSGEEPYTIAILLKENFPSLDFEIIATDLDETILEKAKEGKYRIENLKGVFSKGVIDKYFDQLDTNTIQVKNEIKRKIKFEKHNLLEDLYPKFLDMIVCRNVLIYFKEDAKQKIYDRFCANLNDQGIIFIGATEQIFKPEQHHLKIVKSFFYQKQKEGI
ncbi:protein-glutamate O-methyltransferase CheR [Bacillus mexicanus]|uniref:CheR family methyltransferase n=1 Tax=Bacillus mexicanus TaxID=2834415 RepID=UPI003D1ADA64